MNLLVLVRNGSDSETIWKIIRNTVVLNGAILREGIAPASNMERELEKMLNNLKKKN